MCFGSLKYSEVLWIVYIQRMVVFTSLSILSLFFVSASHVWYFPLFKLRKGLIYMAYTCLCCSGLSLLLEQASLRLFSNMEGKEWSSPLKKQVFALLVGERKNHCKITFNWVGFFSVLFLPQMGLFKPDFTLWMCRSLWPWSSGNRSLF